METKYEQELTRIRADDPGRNAGDTNQEPGSVTDDGPARGGHPQWWMNLTMEQRVIHYNRTRKADCAHEAKLEDWPVDLRLSYSFDPYSHVDHSEKQEKPKQNENRLRAKIKARLSSKGV